MALFREEDIPWDKLAFPVVRETLKYYFQDRESGVFIPRVGDIHWQSRKSGEYTVTLLQAGS
ncbi:hypothetical protein [Thiolapillus sp.]|uniref:hypothetical protein n=1 Tax=Thiolapillus sp. TaxID=2017437 RepID=UPI003AF7A98F